MYTLVYIMPHLTYIYIGLHYPPPYIYTLVYRITHLTSIHIGLHYPHLTSIHAGLPYPVALLSHEDIFVQLYAENPRDPCVHTRGKP